MKVSFAITVKDELLSLVALLDALETDLKEVNYEWEIVILRDCSTDLLQSTAVQWNQIIEKSDSSLYKFVEKTFQNDFSEHKNYLNSQCTGDYIFQIDADEMPHEFLVHTLGMVLSTNKEIDLIWVPRINTVEGLTDEHIKRWGWRIEKIEDVELPVINFPDYQSRIYRRNENIRWHKKVHEQIIGVKTYAHLPPEIQWCLFHHKSIERQEKQNEFYRIIG